ncbi:CPBP family intramembrane metalloprotease [Chryseobacterium sp. RP-3-3]|uniref:CPBP family intramembrane metalloprotease n=1 Tax=Chryseobacterium antibioticum TaxID=2728847 RepID=A0A7Y0FPQ2_9FLAO|nr:type II CAAX endopeptidase family protein [Chryseobacterium antibioticum]NML68337.1 CPBP family intramembrane metalloprotease [Chryseobacterium antibioticum]
MNKIIPLFVKIFFLQFIISIPFFFIAFKDFSKKELTVNLWISSFFPELICGIYFLYKLDLIKDFRTNLFLKFWNFKNLKIISLGVFIPTAISFILNYFNLINISLIENIDYLNIVIFFLLLLLSAFMEEIFFRFIPYSILKDELSFKNIILTSLIFSSFHLFNPNFNIIGLINIFIAGIFLSLVYVKTNSIIISTIVHFLWNFLIGCIYGSNISGLKIYSIANYNFISNNKFLTGVDFGFEGSILTTIIFSIFCFVLIRSTVFSK